MRDLALALMMVMVIPMALARPFNAYLLWGWTGFLAPTTYFYGFMYGARINFICAALTIVLVFLKGFKIDAYARNPMAWMYILFAMHATLVLMLAYEGNPNNLKYYEILIKGLVFSLAMPIFVQSREHIHAILVVIGLGVGVHGVLNGLKSLLTFGAHNMLGPTGTMLEDRNHLSVALAILIPILFYLRAYAKNRIAKAALEGVILLILIAVLAGGSRAGFITLAVVGVGALITAKKKLAPIALVVIVYFGFFQFAPESIVSRISTISAPNQDDSFMGRVAAWEISSAIALENPAFGGGFHAVQTQHVWDKFKFQSGLLSFLNLPPPEFSPKAAHSIYFELLGDMGFLGAMLFGLMVLRVFYLRRLITQMTLKKSSRVGAWTRDLANALALSVLAYLIGGASVSLAYFELIYVIFMLMELLVLIVNDSNQDMKDMPVSRSN